MSLTQQNRTNGRSFYCPLIIKLPGLPVQPRFSICCRNHLISYFFIATWWRVLLYFFMTEQIIALKTLPCNTDSKASTDTWGKLKMHVGAHVSSLLLQVPPHLRDATLKMLPVELYSLPCLPFIECKFYSGKCGMRSCKTWPSWEKGYPDGCSKSTSITQKAPERHS